MDVTAMAGMDLYRLVKAEALRQGRALTNKQLYRIVGTIDTRIDRDHVRDDPESVRVAVAREVELLDVNRREFFGVTLVSIAQMIDLPDLTLRRVLEWDNTNSAHQALLTVRRHLSAVSRPATFAETEDMLHEAMDAVQRYLTETQVWTADLAWSDAALEALRASVYPDIYSVHVEAPQRPHASTRAVVINSRSWDLIKQSPFWRLRYEPGLFRYPDPPRLLRVWCEKSPGSLRVQSILFRTTMSIRSRENLDSSTFMLIERDEGATFRLRCNWNLECPPDSFSYRLVLGDEMRPDDESDFPNLRLGMNPRGAEEFVNYWYRMRSGMGASGFEGHRTRNCNTTSTLDREIRRDCLRAIREPSQLVNRIDSLLLSGLY